MSRHPFQLESITETDKSLQYMPAEASNFLEINRIYRCSPAALYNYFVNADKLKSWMANIVEGDFAPGGKVCLAWNGNTELEIVFEEMVPAKRIVFKMIDTQAVNTRVVLGFHRHEKISFLQLSHQFPSEQVEPERIQVLRCKWAFFLDNLASVCEFHFDQRPLKAEEEGWRWLTA